MAKVICKNKYFMHIRCCLMMYGLYKLNKYIAGKSTTVGSMYIGNDYAEYSLLSPSRKSQTGVRRCCRIRRINLASTPNFRCLSRRAFYFFRVYYFNKYSYVARLAKLFYLFKKSPCALVNARGIALITIDERARSDDDYACSNITFRKSFVKRLHVVQR